MKHCTVKLKRLSSATINRHLYPRINRNCDKVKELKLNLRIRDSILEIENQGLLTATKNTFNMQIKISSTGVAVLNTFFPRNLRNKTSRNLVHAVPKTKAPSNKLTNRRVDYKNIDSAWNQCKSKDIVDCNAIVMAKIKGYVPWPAKVIEIINKNRFNQFKVEFFGVEPHEMYGIVTMKEICLFKNAEKVIRLILKNNCPKFMKAVQETEIVCGIPQSNSILY